MKSRKPTPMKKDNKVFNKLAKKIKKVNVKPTAMRGGTRM